MGTTTHAPERRHTGRRDGHLEWAAHPAAPLLLFAVLRLPVILAARAPAIVPDETGSWAVGRWLSGLQPLIEMNDMPAYPLLPGAALAPLQWLPVDSATRYQLGLLVGSSMVVAAAALLRSSVRAVTDDDSLAAAAFAITLLFPATFLTSMFTWAEATVILCVAAFVRGLAACLLADGPTPAVPVVATGLVAAAAPFAHGRLVALPVAWLALLAWAVVRRSAQTPLNAAPRSRLLAGATLTAAAALCLRLLDEFVKERVWSEPGSAEDAVLTGLLNPANWPEVLRAATGQLWYATVASLGLAVVGAILALRVVSRRSNPPLRALGSVLVACGLGVAATSAAFMSRTVANVGVEQQGRMGGIRWDHLVYGRYLDVMLLLATIGGVCALRSWSAASSLRALGAAAATAFIPAVLLGLWWADADLAASVRPTTAGLAVVSDLDTSLPLFRATSLAIAGIAALSLIVAVRRVLLLPLLSALLCLGPILAAGIAADLHGPRSTVRVFDNLPDPIRGVSEVVIPSDLNEGMPYVLVWHRMQVVAVPYGWHFDFSQEDSATVATSPPADAGLVALANTVGAPPETGDWELHWANDDVSLWSRRR